MRPVEDGAKGGLELGEAEAIAEAERFAREDALAGEVCRTSVRKNARPRSNPWIGAGRTLATG